MSAGHVEVKGNHRHKMCNGERFAPVPALPCGTVGKHESPGDRILCKKIKEVNNPFLIQLKWQGGEHCAKFNRPSKRCEIRTDMS